MALKFAGRTPSSALRRPHRVLSREAASRKSRNLAARLGIVAFLLLLFATAARNFIDNSAFANFAPQAKNSAISPNFVSPNAISSTRNSSESLSNSASLEIPRTPPTTNFARTANAIQTLGALPIFFGATLQQSSDNGILALFGGIFLAFSLWFGLSFLGEWRKPPLGFLALLTLQFAAFSWHYATISAPNNASAIAKNSISSRTVSTNQTSPNAVFPSAIAKNSTSLRAISTNQTSTSAITANSMSANGTSANAISADKSETSARFEYSKLENSSSETSRVGIGAAFSIAWDFLSRTQQLNTFLSVCVLLAAFWWWGAGLEERAARWTGPQKAQGFLRRRRVSYQSSGALLMFLAFCGTIVSATLLFAPDFANRDFAAFSANIHVLLGVDALNSLASSAMALLVFAVMNAIFLQGRRLWHRLS